MHKAPRVILVNKGHLVVVVLGLKVLKVTREIMQHKDQQEISVLKIQKVTKEIPVLKVPRVMKMTSVLEVEKVIKGTLEHKNLKVIRVIQVHRGRLLVVILQTFLLSFYPLELR